jgi:hypothetical protein
MRLNRAQEGRGESYGNAAGSSSAAENVLTGDLAGFRCYVGGQCSRHRSKEEPRVAGKEPAGGSTMSNLVRTSSPNDAEPNPFRKLDHQNQPARRRRPHRSPGDVRLA